MGVAMCIIERLFEALSDSDLYVLRDRTVQVLMRQEGMLASAIVPWTDAVFNSEQVGRLAQEFRAIAEQQSLEDRTRRELAEAAELIEREAVGKTHRFVLFLGN